MLNKILRRLFVSRIKNNLNASGLNIVSLLFEINYVKIEKCTNFGIEENIQKNDSLIFLNLETWKRNFQTHCISRPTLQYYEKVLPTEKLDLIHTVEKIF